MNTGYGDGCGGISVSANGLFLYVPTYSSGVGVYSTSTLSLSTTINMGLTYVCSVAASTDGNYLYVFSDNGGNGYLTKWNIASGTAVWSTPFCYWGGWMYDAVSPDGNYAYCTSTTNYNIYKINTNTEATSTLSSSGYSYGIAVSNDGNIIYQNGGYAYNTLSSSDPSWAVAPGGLGQLTITTNGMVAYAVDYSYGYVYIIT